MSESTILAGVRPANVSERLSISELVERGQRPAPAVVFRQLGASGTLFNNYVCRPGSIALLRCAEPLRFAPFRDALLCRGTGGAVNVRYGDRALELDDVHCVDVQRNRWGASPATDILASAGAPEWLIKPLLTHLGLPLGRERRATQFSGCELYRLAVACALVSRASVLFVDSPSERLSPAWCDRVATLLLDTAVQSQRIVIVNDRRLVSPIWERSRLVVVHEIAFAADFGLGDVDEGVDDIIRTLERLLVMQNAASAAVPDYILTRPRFIYEAVARVPEEAVVAEKIVNPQLELASDLSAPQPKSGTELEPKRHVAKRKAPKRKRLTRVRTRERLMRGSVSKRLYRKCSRWLRRMSGAKKLAERGMPSAARIKKHRMRERAVESFLTPVALLALIVIACHLWF